LFGHGHGDISRLAAHQRRFVGRRSDHHRTRQAFFAQIVLDEFLHFAAALADQSDHDGIGIGVARQHRQQRGFSHAGAGENAHALAGAAGGEGVEGANAQIQFLADAAAAGGGDGRGLERIGRHAQRQRALSVHRLAEAIDHPAQPGLGGIDGSGAILEIGAGAQSDSVQRTQRHDQGPAVAKPHHFAGNCLVISDTYAALTAQADRPLRAGHFHRQPFQACDPAKTGQGGNGLDFVDQRAHISPCFEAFERPGAVFSKDFLPFCAPILRPRI